jgi:hypothetical protein
MEVPLFYCELEVNAVSLKVVNTTFFSCSSNLIGRRIALGIEKNPSSKLPMCDGKQAEWVLVWILRAFHRSADKRGWTASTAKEGLDTRREKLTDNFDSMGLDKVPQV